MKKYVPALFLVGIVFFSLLLVLANISLPRPIAFREKYDSPGAMRALENLKAIAKEKHPVGSSHHNIVGVYIKTMLEDWGYTVKIMNEVGFNDTFRGEPMNPVSSALKNIMTIIPGKSKRMVLVTAHYDSAENSFGAGDDGMGTVTLLEILRVLKDKPVPELSLGFIFFDAEERGMIGSASFVKKYLQDFQIETVINSEGLTSGPIVVTESGASRQWYQDYYYRSPKKMPAASIVEAFFGVLPFGTDLNEFEEAGLDGVTVSPVSDFFLYHTPSDNVENISTGTLQQSLDQVFQMALYASSGKIKYQGGGAKNYFAFFPGLLFSYDLMGSVFLIAFCLIGVIAVFVLSLRKEKISVPMGFGGFGLSVLTLAFVFLAGYFLFVVMEWLIMTVGGFSLKRLFYPLILLIPTLFVAVLYSVMEKLVLAKILKAKLTLASNLLIFLIVGSVVNFALFQASYIILVPVLLIACASCAYMLLKNKSIGLVIVAVASVFSISLVLQALFITASALSGFSLYPVYLMIVLIALVLPLSLHQECHGSYFFEKKKSR